jgi:rubrerythrin
MSIEVGPVREILKKALQVEVDGHTFYSMAAEQATKPAIQSLFLRLARDEIEHKTYLKNVMRRLEELGGGSFFVEQKDPGLGEFSSQIFTDEFREQARGVASAPAVLSIGMQLEANAVAFFTAAAEGSEDPQAKGFFRFLADWEGQHYRILERLLQGVQSGSPD